jgi:tight adherence protein C
MNFFASDSGLLIVAVCAAAVGLFFFGVSALVGRATDPARRRFEAIARDSASSNASGGIRTSLLLLPGFLLPGNSNERSRMTDKVRHAGFKSPAALHYIYGAKVLLAIGLPLVWYAVSLFLSQLTSSRVIFVALLVSFIGSRLPNIWLDSRITKRHRLLRNGFPDALDLLTVCVESGLGLAAAVQRVADELEVSHPELAMELGQVNAQMRAGVERETALRGLADRTGLDDIRGLVGLLVQTLRFGTGVADALRVYSEEFRDKRMQRAEEVAAKIGTKLIFPLVLCLFPSFFVVAIGPAVIRIMEALGAK